MHGTRHMVLKKLIYGCAGPRGCAWASPSCGERGCSVLSLPSFSQLWLLAAGHRLQAPGLQQLQLMGSVTVVHRLSCSTARGVFLGQESNWYPLHCELYSYPLDHQGRPCPLLEWVLSLLQSKCKPSVRAEVGLSEAKEA